MRYVRTVLALPLVLIGGGPLAAEILKSAAVGCAAVADAQKIAQAKDKAAALAISQPLVASRACISFAKGLKIDIDERKPPLVCIRLPGDLSCYWLATAAIDDHPGEKGAGGGGRGGKRR